MKSIKNGLGDDKGMEEKNMIAFTKKENNNTKQSLTELFYQFLPLVGFYEHDGNELKITQHK